jgi:hypothetical protein
MSRALIASALLLWATGILGAESAPPSKVTTFGVTLPAVIKSTLDKEYPGWKYAPASPAVKDLFRKQGLWHPPNLLSGDFDVDGRKDFAVQIARTNPGDEEQIAIAFLAKDEGYEEAILESRGLDPDVYLSIRKAPSPENPSVKRDVIVVMGGITGETWYGLEGGKFHEVASEKAPEVVPDPPAP